MAHAQSRLPSVHAAGDGRMHDASYTDHSRRGYGGQTPGAASAHYTPAGHDSLPNGFPAARQQAQPTPGFRPHNAADSSRYEDSRVDGRARSAYSDSRAPRPEERAGMHETHRQQREGRPGSGQAAAAGTPSAGGALDGKEFFRRCLAAITAWVHAMLHWVPPAHAEMCRGIAEPVQARTAAIMHACAGRAGG
jgi:hypothetical protein